MMMSIKLMCMHSFVFLIVLNLIYCSGTVVNMEGQSQLKSNAQMLKYQKMAEEIVHSHFHVEDKDLKRVTLNKVTEKKNETKNVWITTTNLVLQLSLVNGKSPKCQCKVHHTFAFKNVSCKCDGSLNLQNVRTTSRKKTRNPKNPKYIKLARISLNAFFESPGHKPFKKEDVKKFIIISGKKVRIHSKIETVIAFRVITRKNKHFTCTTGLAEKPWLKLQPAQVSHINCTRDGHKSVTLSGGKVSRNPNDRQYKEFAIKVLKFLYLNDQVKKVRVTKVTMQGVITRIYFKVIPNNGNPFTCQAKIKRQKGKLDTIIHSNCDNVNSKDTLGDMVTSNPHDSKYKQLAIESFEKYKQTYGFIQIKELKVTKVEAVVGLLCRIKFTVIPKKGSSLLCQSDIAKTSRRKNIKVTCKKEHIHGAGREIQQNPNNHKYKQLAKESIDIYQRKNGFIDIKELKVTKVTSQVVHGTIFRIQFNVITTTGQSFPCNSEILEKMSFRDKSIDITCKIPTIPPNPPENIDIPGREIPQNPDNPKYKQLAKEAFGKYQETHGSIMIKELKVTTVTTQVVSGIITRIGFTVITRQGKSFTCLSEIFQSNSVYTKDIKTSCEKSEIGPDSGRELPQNPDNPRYKQLAETAFEKYQETHGTIMIRELKVTRVTKQIVSGVITRISFSVIPEEGKSFLCNSEILQNHSGEIKDMKVTCDNSEIDVIPGGEIPQNPDNPKYKQLAKEAFAKYQETHGSIMIKELKVTTVTTQVVSGIITRIGFTVITRQGKSLTCLSEIFQSNSVYTKAIKTSCEKSEIGPDSGGELPQNPDNPRYKQLAKTAFEKYQETHGTIMIRELKVTRVTKQIVSGVITRISFSVIPEEGKSFLCNSEILQNHSAEIKDIKVTCENSEIDVIPGGEIPQNPDNPKYKQLAQEAFAKYQETHGSIMIKELKVTTVTTQVVSGIITRIGFTVITRQGKSFTCLSEIFQSNSVYTKDIKTSCEKSEIGPDSGGELPQNPDNPRYKQLAKTAFEKYQESHGTIMIRELKVTRVTKQIVSGVITRISFSVIAEEGKSFLCFSEILQNHSAEIKNIKVTCENSEIDVIPGGEIPQNPDNPKYKQLAKEAFAKYQETHGSIMIKELKVTTVTTQVVSGIITRIGFTVITRQGKSFTCLSEIFQSNSVYTKDIKTSCEKSEIGPNSGGELPQNPDNPRYKQLAETAFEKYQESHGTIMIRELKVTRVTKQIVSGVITRISFSVNPEEGKSFLCFSEILQNHSAEIKNIKVTCENPEIDVIPGGEIPQNPDNPRYKQLAETAFEKYQETHGTIMIRELKVTRVTKQIVSGVITRISFSVIPEESKSFLCNSEILQNHSGEIKDMKVTCDNSEIDVIPGGEIPQNPDNPKYKQLAKEAFAKYQETHGSIMIKELKVTTVTTQVGSGIISKIGFTVIPKEGKSFTCLSEIFQSNSVYTKDIKTSCEKSEIGPDSGGELPQNPDNPWYKQLAKAAFEKYQKTYGTIMIRELKVTKVIKKFVSGVITKINFSVIPKEGKSLSCFSEILQIYSDVIKDMRVTCEHSENDVIPGGEIPQNPDNPNYKLLAKEAFAKYQESHGSVMIRELKVTTVTTQAASGLITRIGFTVIPKRGKSYFCFSEIFQNHQKNIRNIKVSCESSDNVADPDDESPLN